MCSSVVPPEGVIEELGAIWYRRDNPHADTSQQDYEDQIRDEIERMAGAEVKPR